MSGLVVVIGGVSRSVDEWRAEAAARDIDVKYRCPICGRDGLEGKHHCPQSTLDAIDRAHDACDPDEPLPSTMARVPFWMRLRDGTRELRAAYISDDEVGPL